MRIDHFIYAAPDLESAVDDLHDRLGVRASGGGQHTGQGTHNKLLALGPTTYLEIIGPDPDQPEPANPRPYGVDGITHPEVVGWALTCDDIEAAATRARAAGGFDPGHVIDGHRLTPTGEMLTWRLTSNALTAGVIPFLISWAETAHPAAAAPSGLRLESFHIEHPDPPSIMGALRAVGAEVEIRPAVRPGLVLQISGPAGSIELR